MEECTDAARQAVEGASGSPSDPAASASPSDAEDEPEYNDVTQLPRGLNQPCLLNPVFFDCE
jgi:hypothetical protein